MFDLETAQKVAMGLANFSIQNGITILDPNEELIGTSTLRIVVERRGRTDEEIEAMVRQFKVIFLLSTPICDIKIQYKVV